MRGGDLRRERLVRHPLRGRAGCGLLHHLVDLLEREALGLRDEEVRVHEGRRAQAAPDEEDGGFEVAFVLVDHIGRDDGNDLFGGGLDFVCVCVGREGEGVWEERLQSGCCGVRGKGTYGVPEPVGGGGQGDAAGADGEGEDLADDDPRAGAPRGGEEEDVDGDEGDLGVDGGGVVRDGGGVGPGADGVGLVEADGDADDGDDELAAQHAEGAPDQQHAAAELLHRVEGDRGADGVDEVEDQRDQEGVGDGARGLQEGGRVVEDEIDARPLLHHLQRGTQDGLAQVRVRLPQRAFEAVGPARHPARGRDQRALVLLVCDDLRQLGLDVLRRAWLAAQPGERLAGLFDFTTLHVVPRRLWQEDETHTEHETEDELDADGDAVGARIGAVLREVVDDRGQ